MNMNMNRRTFIYVRAIVECSYVRMSSLLSYSSQRQGQKDIFSLFFIKHFQIQIFKCPYVLAIEMSS